MSSKPKKEKFTIDEEEESAEDIIEESFGAFVSVPVDEAEAMPKEVKVASNTVDEGPLYSSALWKGAMTVFFCSKCSTQLTDEDDMKLHVVSHFPKIEQESVLDKITRKE